MVYRQVSIARVMRKIAINDYENIYFQDRDGTKKLLQLKGYSWRLDEYKKYNFFELEI
ncbi:hypothetical protein [Solibacillus sp. FSL K6-1523]|uniref:hypothetical protein n=1 Tax=Solibacillus sp. FSL K6-1523 TaxID=2921471 RepID=UPI0030F6C3D4